MPLPRHTGTNVIALGMYTYMYMFMYIYVSGFIHESSGQMVTVTMKPTTYAQQGTPAFLMCNYSVNDTFYTFNFLQWNKETDLLASFMKGSMQPYYPPEWGDKYSMTTDSIDSSSVLTVSSVQFPSDEGRYICKAQFRKAGTGSITGDTSTLVNVIVLPTSITLSDSTGTYPSTEGKAYLVEGVNHKFNCTVPGINPRASFSWSVGSRNATEDNSNDIVAADGLTTSSSTVTLSPVWSDHGETLLCQASNKEGHAGISVSLTLDIKVPPKTSSMTLSDTNGALMPGGTASVDQDASHVFTCQAQSRPAATIQWDLGSNSYQQSTIGPATRGPGDGLVYTTSMWTFTPGRDNHRQQVKCEANTTESQSPYPSVIVTLNVNGPPDVADIRGSPSMSENVTTALTCTADMGYPDNWNLVWSNGGSPINGPNTASSASGSRFIFTSTLNLTPRRQDNGNTISCAARRGSWTAAPQQTLGPLDVAFCTKGVSVMSHPNAVIEDNTVSWSCKSESSNPATEWTWFKNGTIQSTAPTTEETDGDYHGKRSTATFVTDPLVKMDNGAILICCAKKTTQCTTDVCSSSILNVQYAPTFSPPSQSPLNPVLEGGEVLLTCSLDANPNPSTIIWEKQGPGIGPTPDLSVYRNGTSNLTLSNIKRQQAGNYRCKANNGIPDGTYDAVSSEVTVIVHYEVNITNKVDNMEGANDGTDAVLACIARGNPEPVMVWYDTNGTEIGNNSGSNSSKFIVTMEVSGGDEVYGYEVTSNLTIKNVDSQVDYGVYVCNSSNGIGKEDILEIILNGTRLPDMPGGVKITNRTAASLTVVWSGGFDGGEEQSFRVSYLKTSDSTEVFSDQTGRKTTSTAFGLDDYTEYEIRVYAKNIIGENNKYASIKGYTLPKPPGPDAGIGITVEYNTDEGTVKVTGLRVENSCIQLEVKYEGNDTWQECGECIASNRTVTLSEWCAASQKRRRRAVGDIEDVRAKLCIGGLCSKAAPAEQVKNPPPVTSPDNRGIIVGAVVGGVVLLAIIIALATYLVRMSPADQKSRRKKTTDSFSNGSDIELQSPSNVAGPEEGNGIANEGVQNHEYDKLSRKERHPVYPNPAVRGDSLPPETGAYEEMKVAASKTCSENATNKVQENVEKSSPEETVNETTNKVTNRDSKPPITRPKPKSIKKYQPPNRSADEIPKRKAELAGATETTETTDGSMADGKPRTTSIKRYTVESGDTYAQVNKNLPPKPKGINPPQNLPDVTYASANKDQKPSLSPLPEDYGAKKKPKKYVPPSARAAEESAYEEVRINDNDKGKNPSAEGDGNTYDGVGAQQDTGGRTANDDGLIYVEVGHARVHPPDQPPIQTEPSTEYASLDFSHMSKKEDKS